jgi:calcineurin-like phosphoesterase family protein
MDLTRRHHPRRLVACASLVLALVAAVAAQDLTLPNRKDSVHFAVIGDSGTGGSSQYKVAERLTAMRAKFPFDFALMLGDNLYGNSAPKDYASKFEKPYKTLLDGGVKFYATLGNHDNTNERFYKPFNMNGERFYTFKPANASVRFFSLDTNYMDQEQIAWLQKELANSQSDWKILFFHHPLYSSGGEHGSDLLLREKLEPVFVKSGVDVVFSGHDHFYERVKPQKGILYFVSGGAGKVRKGDVQGAPFTAKAFDNGYHFMLVEVTNDSLYFQTISDQGVTIDSGTFTRVKRDNNTASAVKPATPAAKATTSPAKPTTAASRPTAPNARP